MSQLYLLKKEDLLLIFYIRIYSINKMKKKNMKKKKIQLILKTQTIIKMNQIKFNYNN